MPHPDNVKVMVTSANKTGRVMQFFPVREVPDNQRPECGYDVVMAMLMMDDGTFELHHYSEIKRYGEHGR